MSDTNWQSYGHEVIWVGFEKDMSEPQPNQDNTQAVKSIVERVAEIPHTVIDLEKLMEIVVYG